MNVRLVPVLGARSPVAAVVNTTLQEVSLDSSATVTLLAAPSKVFAVIIPTPIPASIPVLLIVTPVPITAESPLLPI